MQGRVVAAYGRRFEVELPDGRRLDCTVKGKRGGVACGDDVDVRESGDGGVIDSVAPRRSLLYRSDAFREKLIAANVTQAVIVLAPVPTFSEELLTRCLVAAEAKGVAALLVLNKADLEAPAAAAHGRLRLYEALGYPLVAISARRDVAPLAARLRGHVNVLVGQSGMGKSTIVNALVPGAAAATAEHSAALDSGRHTTSHARLYHLSADTDLIDSPGMQEFGLHHVPAEEIGAAFPELRPHLGRCRFRNCRHLHEPDCAVAAAAAAGDIDERRLAIYRTLRREREGLRAG
ncbi:MAG TPA: ribosome small subunit-dependent GTPase A [Pelomicrobium sp.]|nr:ribosome small subunit-dependent GTPase A [Pelomicrobium sp.]